MSEERGFDVMDKRGVRTDGMQGSGDTGEPSNSAAGESMGEPDLEDEDGDDFVGMPDVTVTGVLWTSVQLLTNRAWSSMGLIPNPVTREIQRDLNEAKRAIDVLTDMVKHLQADTSAEEKRELQNMLSDMRINFVRQSNSGS